MSQDAVAIAASILSDGGADWDQSFRRPETAPMLDVEGFEGPLDWLLERVQAQKIDLAKLSIGALVDSFAAALDTGLARHGHADLARWADWLVMAATLALLRSRLLLPAGSPEAMQALDEAEALRRRMVHRAEISAAADWLERRPQLGQEVHGRGTARLVGAPGRDKPDQSAAGASRADYVDLIRACLVALKVPEAADIYQTRPVPQWTVNDAMARLRRLLPELPDGSGLTAYLPQVGREAVDRARQCRAAVATTMAAVLELTRSGELSFEQDTPWATPRVNRALQE